MNLGKKTTNDAVIIEFNILSLNDKKKLN